ncbi:MAG: sensor histidine kinase [Gammaproteobacteria bacterium]|nr:MAG: sensor histidine kinase [Gammaproteobacteria bacterium]
MSLRGLINVRIILSVVFILLIGSVSAVWQARQSVEKEVKSSINLALQMIEFGFAQMPVAHRQGSGWLSQISALQQVRHLQISIAHEGDQAITFTTQQTLDESESLPPSWFVAAVMANYLTERYDIEMADGSHKSILITANPMDEISEAWGESKAFFWSIVAMLWIIFLAVNLVFHSMLRAVKSILAGLHLVESGKYDITLPHFKISEFDAIASEINKMSLALKIAQENNQALARHTMHIQESERRTMSRELHDEMGQSLTAIKAMAVTTKQANVEVPPIADSIIEICNHLAKVVRSMMRTLHPLSLSELGLNATLTDLINEWRRRSPTLSILFHYDEHLDSLDNEVSIHVYRVVQECLTNVVRHSQASEVSVSLDFISNQQLTDRVELNINDNGIGGEVNSQGFGILAMRERVENLGGQFSFKSTKDTGVQVHAWMPFVGKKEHD